MCKERYMSILDEKITGANYFVQRLFEEIRRSLMHPDNRRRFKIRQERVYRVSQMIDENGECIVVYMDPHTYFLNLCSLAVHENDPDSVINF